MSRRTFRPGARAAYAGALVLVALAQAGAPAAPAPYRHVVIISIDGLHEADVTDPRLAGDLPALHRLAQRGISYEHAQTTAPSDSFPGTLAVLTGARPGTTGVYYDETFDRSLMPAGSAADAPRGAVVDLTEDLDRDPSLLDGGGDAGAGSIDPAKLPQRCTPAGCAPLWPHDYPLANTLFDVLGAHGLTGFLVEKHPAYAVAFRRGSRRVAFFAPEIDAQVAVDHGRLIDRTTPAAAASTLATVGDDEATAEAYDELKVQAVLRALAGRGRAGTTVPALVMLNLQSVNFAQKAATGGIAAAGRPSPRLREALRYTDGAVGRIAALLVERGLAANTLLVVFAKHGQAPRMGGATLVARSTILEPLRAAGIGVAHLTSDDVALFWLAHRGDAVRAARLLAPFGRIVRSAPGPTSSRVRRDRAPDLILAPPPGIVFVGNPAKATKRAEHGGFSSDDRNVPLIVWSTRFGGAGGRAVAAPVETRQIAPTVLAALGIDPRELSGVRAEGTATLPGLPLP